MYFRFNFILLLFLSTAFNGFAQESADDLKIYFEEDGQVLRVKADNHRLYPLSIKLSFELKGLRPFNDIPSLVVLPGDSSNYELLTFSIPEGRSWGYKYGFTYYLGDANATHDQEQVYLLPFEVGERFLLSQGYNGQSSHQNENALDFTMPKGTKITAARRGIVIDLKEDSNKGCPSAACHQDGNYVRILHEDGTIADYYHLQQNGALVELKQRVNAGDVIGLAGATGWASGSHLHFMVFKASENGRQSIPTKFKISENRVEFLREDEWYLSVR